MGPRAARHQIIVHVLQGCVFLHGKGMLHNFINSSSVYLDAEWNARLGNLEYSCDKFIGMLDSDRRFHHKYMSPETIHRNNVSTFSDVFSFGCVTWELFGRTQPWSWLEHSDVTLLAQHNRNNSVRLPVQPCWPSHVK